jgi:anti-sigma B factor antagonist
MPTHPSRLVVSHEGDISLAHFTDRRILDELTIHELETELTTLIKTGAPPVKLILDFSTVEHLSSAALGMLITLNKEIGACKGRLGLAHIRPQILEVFKITRLNKLFSIHPSVDSAKQALGG